MKTIQATAEVFLIAFKALSRQEQEAVLKLIAKDRKLLRKIEDLSDLLVIEQERGKPSRPLREYIEEREKRERSKVKGGR